MRAQKSFALAPALLLVGLLIGFPSIAQEQQKDETTQEYVSTAEQSVLLQTELQATPGREAHIITGELPAGWVGGWHYHTADVFVYVVEGEFVVDVEGAGRRTFGPGDVFHEPVNRVMQARNGSSTGSTKLILFQVGGIGEPLMFMAEEPAR